MRRHYLIVVCLLSFFLGSCADSIPKNQLYRKVAIDVDYIVYNPTFLGESSYVVLKDGWKIPCGNLDRLIEQDYIRKRDTTEYGMNRYEIVREGLQVYVTMDYHMHRVYELLQFTDNIKDANTYYSPRIIIDHFEMNRETFMVLKRYGCYSFPIFERAVPFYKSLIQFKYSLAYMNDKPYLIYKSDSLPGVCLLYSPCAPYASEMTQYPVLLYDKELPDDTILLEASHKGCLYLTKKNNWKQKQISYVLWKEDKYLACISEMGKPQAVIDELSAVLDTAIAESNMMAVKHWNQ